MREIKVLRSAAYAYSGGRPVIIVETRRADVHLVSCEATRKLLKHATCQLKGLEDLREKGQRIPDGHCRSYADESCPYRKGSNQCEKSEFLIEKCADQLDGNLPEVAERVVGIVRNLLEDQGFSIKESSWG